jgi:hypothetical protein
MSESIATQFIIENQHKIKFIESSHTYIVGDRRLPSVSHIMSEMSKQYYTDINPEVLENARERGTRVHKAIEMFERLQFPDQVALLTQVSGLRDLHRLLKRLIEREERDDVLGD